MVIVDEEKCIGCGQCEICPGDLMVLDVEKGKAFIRDASLCWDCMSCVKACPVQAILPRLPFQIADFGATLMPRVEKDRIIWTLKDAEGNIETFEIKTLSA